MKFLLIMKLTVLLLTVGCLHAYSFGFSQEKINLSLKDAKIKKVLNAIQHVSNYRFIYNDGILPNEVRVDISATNETVQNVLNKTLMDTRLTYKLLENNLIVIARNDQLIQDVRVKGEVTDKTNGQPLIGVTVKVKGTNIGTVTDVKGIFSLNMPDDAILQVSFVGYETQELLVNGRTDIDVRLQPSATGLNQVVVIGYGSVKKGDLTGAVSTVSSEKITQVKGISNVAQALQGEAAGVQVNAASGQPGEAMKIQIRGTNSIAGGNSPLYVVDGLPLDGLSAQLNPDDIASIEILKDASATAIYGSRGANGVVLITTKRGKEGQGVHVSYSGYYGVQTLRKKMDLINAPEYAELQNEVAANDGNPLPWTSSQIDSLKGRGTDWQDIVYRPASVQNHDLAVSGGNGGTRYYTSFGHYNQNGIIKNSNYTRYSFRGNLDQKITDKLSFTSNLSLQHSSYFQALYTSADYGGIPFQTMVMPPTQGVYDANGNYTVFTGVQWGQTNPVGMARELWNPSNSLRLIGNSAFNYEIIQGLKLRVSAGIDNTWGRSDYFAPPTITFGQPGGVASVGYSNSTTFITENTISYQKGFGKHNIDAVAGISYQSSVAKNLSSGTATGFISTVYQDNNIQSATTKALPGTGYGDNKLVSYIGRVNYNYNGKYFATVTGRYDGSSVFGENNKFALFPSGALAWNVSKESFMQDIPVLSNLKLRTSYGISGNQAIGSYQTLAQINNVNVVFNNQYYTGYTQGSLENKALKWETTRQFDLGIDLALFNDRIQLTADYYDKKTSNLLLNVTLPPSTGFGTVLENVGAVRNRGDEFQLTTQNTVGVVKWTSVLTYSHNDNKILDLGKDAQGKPITYKEVGAGGNWFPMILGQPMSQLYGQQVIGVYQSDGEAVKDGEPQKHAGDYRFLDYNHDGVVDDNDKHVLTHMNPKFTFGFNNTISYKNFDLSVLFVGSYGNDIVNEFRKYNLTLNGLWTPTQQAFDNRWKGPGTSNAGDKPSINSMQYTRDYANSLWVEDGSYLRLRDITLGYTFSSKALKAVKISSLYLYVSAQNYLTITKYSGYDPEASWASSIVNGWDRGVYPSMKSLTAGVKVNF